MEAIAREVLPYFQAAGAGPGLRGGALVVPPAGLDKVGMAPLRPLARNQRDWVV
jgi:hypothetical protein